MQREAASAATESFVAPEPEPLDSPLRKLQYLIVRANAASRDPIDLNYIAVPRELWEDIMAVIRRA